MSFHLSISFSILTVIILFFGRDFAIFKGTVEIVNWKSGGSDGYGPSDGTRSSEKTLGREPWVSLLNIWV